VAGAGLARHLRGDEHNAGEHGAQSSEGVCNQVICALQAHADLPWKRRKGWGRGGKGWREI